MLSTIGSTYVQRQNGGLPSSTAAATNAHRPHLKAQCTRSLCSQSECAASDVSVLRVHGDGNSPLRRCEPCRLPVPIRGSAIHATPVRTAMIDHCILTVQILKRKRKIDECHLLLLCITLGLALMLTNERETRIRTDSIRDLRSQQKTSAVRCQHYANNKKTHPANTTPFNNAPR